MKSISDNTDKHVDALRTAKFNKQHRKPAGPKKQETKTCGNCGRSHEPRNCPAYGKTCNKCSKRNHFARMCRSETRPQKQSVHHIKEETSSDEESTFFVGTVENESRPKTRDEDWSIDTTINGTNVLFKLDTGAQCNVLPIELYKQITAEKLQRSRNRLTSYSGHQLRTLGKATLVVTYKDKLFLTEFQVVDNLGVTPVLGLNSCIEMELLKRVNGVSSTHTTDQADKLKQDPLTDAQEIMKDYEDVFQGIGCFKRNITSRLTPQCNR